MEDKKNDWDPKAKRFVAFFDIMGFKDRILRQKHQKIYADLSQLSVTRKILGRFNNFERKELGESISFTFSDSIILFTKGDSIKDLNKIIFDSQLILKKSLALKIPIKGALSYGVITVDTEKSIYFGQPIIDAFLLHEELLMYTVIADNTFEKKVKEISNENKFNKWFQFYNTPLKAGKANHYILKPLEEDTIKNLNELYLSVSGKPRQYIDNTLEFINVIKTANNTPKLNK